MRAGCAVAADLSLSAASAQWYMCMRWYCSRRLGGSTGVGGDVRPAAGMGNTAFGATRRSGVWSLLLMTEKRDTE
ncbi:Hypothetical predicted protein [Cloeon dipterum]|uniref:Uncharacterized protein n=1 Tax=Cloeon dipterum TaxID=197152 RepID=A0A8S1D7A9_9INSE|nr:Hypothetical predicted protein [Cloeon dipterum]